MTDHALDTLLAEYVAPPVPHGLAGRVAAAALALPQEPRPAHARRAGAMARHDRRGKWLRRPFLLGGVALGLAVSGAVAATLAGLRVDWPNVEAVLADLPFVGRATPADPVPPPRVDPPVQAPRAVEPAPAEESRVATRAGEQAWVPPAVERRSEAPSIAEPVPAPSRSEFVDARLVETRPAAPLADRAGASAGEAAPPAAAERADEPAPVAEPRAPAPGVDESARLRQDRIERAERLRAARQAQIERLQRVQQRRERLRRLQRN